MSNEALALKVKVMPFGKYKGLEISKIKDLGYLLWILDNVVNLEPGLRREIESARKTLVDLHNELRGSMCPVWDFGDRG